MKKNSPVLLALIIIVILIAAMISAVIWIPRATEARAGSTTTSTTLTATANWLSPTWEQQTIMDTVVDFDHSTGIGRFHAYYTITSAIMAEIEKEVVVTSRQSFPFVFNTIQEQMQFTFKDSP